MLFLIALSPILWLIVALSVLHMSAWKACSLALIIALGCALGVEGMTTAHAIQAVLQGVALACWPILLVIVAAIFTYNLTLHTKGMDVIKQMLTSVSSDRRVLILLIGWGFGAFLEGMAGFGTAVAIPAGMLAGIGVNPVLAASVCLVANSVPTAYGSIGIPLVTLSSVTGIDAVKLASYTCLQLAPITCLCPIIMTIAAGGSLKALKGMGLIIIAAILGFLVPELVVATLVGPELAVVAAAIGAIGAIVAAAKMFPVNDPAYAMDTHQDTEPVTMQRGIIACLPFILIFFFLLFTSKLVPFLHDPLSAIKTKARRPTPSPGWLRQACSSCWQPSSVAACRVPVSARWSAYSRVPS